MAEFWRGVFSEAGGSGSLARVATFMVILSALVWVTFITIITRSIPSLTNLTFWVTTVTSSLYGLNKVTTLIAARKDS